MDEKQPHWLTALEMVTPELVFSLAGGFVVSVVGMGIAWVLFRWGLWISCQV